MTSTTEAPPADLRARRIEAAKQLKAAHARLKRAEAMPRQPIPEGPTLAEIAELTVWQFMELMDKTRRERDNPPADPRDQAVSDAQRDIRAAVQFLHETASPSIDLEIGKLQHEIAQLRGRLRNTEKAVEAGEEVTRIKESLARWEAGELTTGDIAWYSKQTHQQFSPLTLDEEAALKTIPAGALQLRDQKREQIRELRQQLRKRMIEWGKSRMRALRPMEGAIAKARQEADQATRRIDELLSQIHRLQENKLTP